MPDRIRITRWAGQHEVAQSKKVKGALSWVAVPTKQGRGYCRLVNEHGAMGLGVWLGLLEIAASRTVENRGVIEGTVEDVAMMMRLSSDDVGSVLPALEKIGWISLETGANAPATSTLPEQSDGATPLVSLQTDIQDGTDGRNGRTDGPYRHDEESAGASLPSGSGSALPRHDPCPRCSDTAYPLTFDGFCTDVCRDAARKEAV